MKPWSREEIRRFIEVYPTTEVASLSLLFGRSARSIASKAHRLMLRQDPELKSALGRRSNPRKRGRINYSRWPKEDRKAALALYPKVSTKAIAERFGRSERSVRYLAIRTGTKKLKKGVDR